MLNHSPTVTDPQTAELAECARLLEERWPMLYDYLARRDRVVERALARIPSPADIEQYAVFNIRDHLARTLGQLPPGIATLAHEEVRRA
jgi:hypothetical protein